MQSRTLRHNYDIKYNTNLFNCNNFTLVLNQFLLPLKINNFIVVNEALADTLGDTLELSINIKILKFLSYVQI